MTKTYTLAIGADMLLATVPDGSDIDRFVGAIIDSYTLAPNDEDEQHDAVRRCIERSGWRP